MRKIIACAPINSPEAMPVQGAIQTSCGVCERAVWIAPSSLKLLDQWPDAMVYCDDDAEAFIKEFCQ